MTVFWKDKHGNKILVAVLSLQSEAGRPFGNSEMEIAPPIDSDRVHSDELVVMLLGYLAASGLCKPDIQPNELLKAWAAFKIAMGKDP